MAPSFPQAAERPWAVERYLVGKTSPGITKVVTFGPKFWKKFARQYRNIRSFTVPLDRVSSWYPKPMPFDEIRRKREEMSRTHDEE